MKNHKNTQNTPQINENIKLFYDRNLFLSTHTHTHGKHLHKHRKVNEKIFLKSYEQLMTTTVDDEFDSETKTQTMKSDNENIFYYW